MAARTRASGRGRTKPGIPVSTGPVGGQVYYLVTARTAKLLGKREGNGGASVGEPPPGGEDADLLPF